MKGPYAKRCFAFFLSDKGLMLASDCRLTPMIAAWWCTDERMYGFRWYWNMHPLWMDLLVAVQSDWQFGGLPPTTAVLYWTVWGWESEWMPSDAGSLFAKHQSLFIAVHWPEEQMAAQHLLWCGQMLLPGDVVGTLSVSLPRPKCETLPSVTWLGEELCFINLLFLEMIAIPV